jgi:hypothetical protein
MTNSPPARSGRLPDDSRNSSFPGSAFASLDPRNHRLGTIINTQIQSQASSTPSAFDVSSPASLDFNFPLTGSPNDSTNNDIDAPPELRMHGRGYQSGRGSVSDASRGPVPHMSQQHRHSLASIDSAFDRDVMSSGALGGWNSSGRGQAVSNPDDSPQPHETDNDNSQQNQIPKSPDQGDESRPAWSELKTKAGKERKRLPLACIACRRKKIRCSGEKPACKHCLRARVPCVYKVTTRKAAPRTDYMAMLDKRLKRMEDRVIKVLPKDESPDLSVTGRASVKPPLPGAGNPLGANAKSKDLTGATKKRTAEDAFTAEMASWTSHRDRQHASITVPNPNSSLHTSENKLFVEGGDALPPQHLQEHLASTFFTYLYGQSYLLLHQPSFMRKLRAGTIPPVLILSVCAISARFSTHPALATEPAFLRGEQWATPARKICERRHYEPNITVLISMVLLGLHYFGTCEGGLSWGFGGMAMRMGYALQLHRELEREPLGRAQISGQQVQNKTRAGEGAGAERRKSQQQTAQAGANIDTNVLTTNNPNVTGTPSITTSKPPELSFTDREIRRRTMWACYLMDTFNSSGTERPSFLNEDYFQIQLPIKEQHFQMEVPGPTEDLHGNVPMLSASRKPHRGSNIPSTNETTAIQAEARANMGVAAYVVRGVVLWKRIVKYLNLGGKDKDPHPIWDPMSEFANLARQITTLRSNLPPELTYSTDNLAAHASERLANQFLLLHIMLAQSALFLHRFAIPTYPSSRPHHAPLLANGMPKTFLTSSAQKVIDSASHISTLIAESAGHTLTVPFAGYCAYASATVHVWGIFSRLPSLETSSKENLRHNYKYLTRMKRYWGMFHYMAESVKDTYRAFADAGQKYTASASAMAATTLLRDRPVSAGAGSVESQGTASPTEISRANTPGHTPSHSASSTATGVRQMFQYGDWFDKYPHGVSEAEWESSHLEYRKDNPGGSDAVMSQRSELQSVEEFFASLSPPSKAEQSQGGRSKKAARRRGKSVAESASDAKPSFGEGVAPVHQAQSQPGQRPQQQRASASMSGGPRPDLQQPPSNLSLGTNFPNSNDPFDLSPTMYRTPHMHSQQQSDPYGTSFSPSPGIQPGTYHPTQSNQIPYNFNHAVPNLDRQMVFGAYAGIDSGALTSAAHTGPAATASPSAGSGFPGQWDAPGMDMGGGFGGFDTSSHGFQGNMGGTAWFMPFNMEPPSFGPVGDELGGGALDGMDFSFQSPGVAGAGSDRSGEQRGSVSAQGGPMGGG